MANIESLHGSDKLREAYPKVNRNFNAVDREVTDLRTRVNNIITTPIDGEAAAQEVVDARNSAAKSKIFDTLDARLEEAEQDNATVNDALATHLAENVTQIVLVTEPFDQLTKTTVNLGFKPKMVTIYAVIRGTKYRSIGVQSEGGQGYCKFNIAETDTVDIQGPAVLLRYNYNNFLSGSITITDTGIEINWSLTGALTGASGDRRYIVSAITHGEG